MHKPLRLGIKRSVERVVDRIEYAFEVAGYFTVPEAQYAKAFALEPILPLTIFRCDFIPAVMPAIKFDHELSREAGKIHNIGTDRHLTAEMRSFDRHRFKSLP